VEPVCRLGGIGSLLEAVPLITATVFIYCSPLCLGRHPVPVDRPWEIQWTIGRVPPRSGLRIILAGETKAHRKGGEFGSSKCSHELTGCGSFRQLPILRSLRYASGERNRRWTVAEGERKNSSCITGPRGDDDPRYRTPDTYR
jgi:hypothetical protein